MLQRNLIYTGITRAKKICVLIGANKVLTYAIHNMYVLKRNTKLKERLTLSLTAKPDRPIITAKAIQYLEFPEAPCIMKRKMPFCIEIKESETISIRLFPPLTAL